MRLRKKGGAQITTDLVSESDRGLCYVHGVIATSGRAGGGLSRWSRVLCTCFACLSSLQIVARPLYDHCKYTLNIFLFPLFLTCIIYCPLFLLFVSPNGNRGWEQKQCTQSCIKHVNACVCVCTVADQCIFLCYSCMSVFSRLFPFRATFYKK